MFLVFLDILSCLVINNVIINNLAAFQSDCSQFNVSMLANQIANFFAVDCHKHRKFVVHKNEWQNLNDHTLTFKLLSNIKKKIIDLSIVPKSPLLPSHCVEPCSAENVESIGKPKKVDRLTVSGQSAHELTYFSMH